MGESLAMQEMQGQIGETNMHNITINYQDEEEDFLTRDYKATEIVIRHALNRILDELPGTEILICIKDYVLEIPEEAKQWQNKDTR